MCTALGIVMVRGNQTIARPRRHRGNTTLMLGDLMCLVRHLADRCQSRAAVDGADVTRSNGRPHDTVQKRGGNVQLCRPGGLLVGVTGLPCRCSSAVQVEVGSSKILCGNATLGS